MVAVTSDSHGVYAWRMAKLDLAEVNQRLAKLQGWALAEDAIQRKFTFAGFPDAVAFIVRLGFDA